MALFFLIIFVIFGSIVVSEKISPLKIPKIHKKIETYITEKYKSNLSNITIQDTEYKELKYQTKVTYKENENLYFIVYYENKKITDTYEEDYIKGKSLINYQENIIKKNILKKTKHEYKITITNTLDNFTDNMKEELLLTKTPENLKIYNLEAELNVKKYDSETISNSINNFNNSLESKKIVPKSYTFIINNPNDKNEAFKLINITSEDIKNNSFKTIINDIIKHNKKNLLDTDIEYEYLN